MMNKPKIVLRENIYSALIQKSIEVGEIHGEKKRIYSPSTLFALKFKRIDCLIEKVVNSEDDFFTVIKVKNNNGMLQVSPLGRELMQLLFIEIGELPSLFPHHQFNPYIQLLAEYSEREEILLWENRNLYAEYGNALKAAKDLNNFVDLIRKDLQQACLKKSVNNFERLPRKNHQSLTSYFDDLFQMNSQLLVLRIDLGYQKISEDIKKSKSDDVYNKIQQHRTDFLGALGKHLSKQLSENILVGYVWRLNYSLSQSWHYHMVICLNGQSVREGLEISKHIDEHWHSVTKGQGVYHSYNPQQSKFRSSGVGLIDRQNVTLRNELKQAALYMTMTDYYSKLITPDKGRTLGRGTVPKKNLLGSKAYV